MVFQEDHHSINHLRVRLRVTVFHFQEITIVFSLFIKTEKMKSQTNQGELWEVFLQSKPGQAFKHVGNVHAYDQDLALENARDVFTRRGEGTAMWVVPSKYIVAVSTSESDYFFEPADVKIYRHPTFYELPEGVKQM